MAAFLFDPQFWLTPKILSSVIGASLLLMGITGGDFSVTSVKIPKIEGIWRGTAAVASVAFLLFGFGLLDGLLKTSPASTASTVALTDPKISTDTSKPASTPPRGQQEAGTASAQKPATTDSATTTQPATVTPGPTPALPPEATVQISVSDSLGNDQAWETVELKLGGYPMQKLSVTKDRRKSLVSFSVPAKGAIAYQIDQTQMRSADGQTIRDQGTGTIDPESSQSFVVDGGMFNGQHRIFLRPATH